MRACCSTIEKYLGRTILSTTYTETYSGTGYSSFLLNNFPVTRITRLSHSPQGVLTIGNSTADRATVEGNSTGLILTSIAGASTTTATLLYATYTTLASLVDAINLVSGWTASTQYGTKQSTELATNIGTFNAKTSCSLRAYSTDFDYYRFDNETGEVYFPTRSPRGIWNILVQYEAGWTVNDVPEDLLQATSELVKLTFNYLTIDANKISQSLGDASWTLASATQSAFERLSTQSRLTLGLYKSRLPAEWRMGVQV